jgi:hypothetical protein
MSTILGGNSILPKSMEIYYQSNKASKTNLFGGVGGENREVISQTRFLTQIMIIGGPASLGRPTEFKKG